MRKTLVIAFGAAALGLSAPANAADLAARPYTKAPVAAPAPIYTWTGFYAGIQGGGGWGDPLERPYDEVARDVLWGKVSPEGAREDYGVVVTGPVDAPQVHVAASDELRARMREERGPLEQRPFFDRGPGYARLAAGATEADVDWLEVR